MFVANYKDIFTLKTPKFNKGICHSSNPASSKLHMTLIKFLAENSFYSVEEYLDRTKVLFGVSQ
jgi:hypothetical protein